MSKKIFLILFGLVVSLFLPNFAEADCAARCCHEIGIDCQTEPGYYTDFEHCCVTIDNFAFGENRAGLILGVPDEWGENLKDCDDHHIFYYIATCNSYSTDCSGNCSTCEVGGFPNRSDADGEECMLVDAQGFFCSPCSKSGVYDASEAKCVNECTSSNTESRILGSDSGFGDNNPCSGDINSYSDPGDGQCESACGADPKCDEVFPNTENCDANCQYEAPSPETCTINGTSYSDGECNPNNKCQRCDVSASATSWSNISSGYVCTVSGETPVSSSDYCNYNENCYDGNCSATKWWTSCDGSGSCRSASDHTDSYSETVTASNLKVLKWDCSEVSPSTVYYCDIRNVCTGGACSGDRYYRACDGGGSCRSDDTGAYHESVYANAGYSLTSGCGKNGTTLCDSTWRSSTPGDNGYGDGGDSICQGMCDSSGNCDYAVNCEVPPEFDFSISIDPTSGSTSRGGSVSATVTLTLTLGDTQSVSFSASGLPSGASVSFSPTSCNPTPTCASTLTINTSATTPTGFYSINVCGTGGGKEHCTGYTLTVTEAFDFSISIAPTLGSVSQGGPASTEITVTKISGDAQTVYLGVADSDAETGTLFSGVGITFSFSPNNNCSPDLTCSRILTISTSDSTPPATYHILISGTSGGASDSKIYTLTVIEAGEEITPPEVITESANNITQTSATLNGTLNSMGNADSCYVWFEYWLKTGDTCDPKADEAIVEPPSPVMDSVGGFSADISGLPLDTTYCFEAYAKNGGSW